MERDAPQRTRPRASGWALRLATATFGLGIGFAASEVLLRAAGIAYPSFYDTDPCCGLVLRPGASGWFTSEGRAFVEVNRDGLRDVAHDRVPDPRRYRIAVIGDSYTLARQVSLEDTYWRVAARELDACPSVPTSDGVEMINFGVDGYGTAQELRTYEARARAFSPDLVLLSFLSGNDVADNHRELGSNPMRPYYLLRDGELELDDRFLDDPRYRRRQTTVWRFAVAASEWSRVIQLINEARLRLRAARSDASATGARPEHGLPEELGLPNAVYLDPPPPVWDEAWTVTEAIVERFRDTVHRDGAAFFVMTLSNGIQVDPQPSVRRQRAAALGVADLGYPDRRMGSHLSRLGVPHLILAPLLAREAEETERCLHGFDNAEPCRGHWNHDGHRIAGKLLAERLCALFAEGRLVRRVATAQ